MPTTNFLFANANIVKTGLFSVVSTFQQFVGPQAQLDFVATGTDLTFQYQTQVGTSAAFQIIVDGSASTPATVGDNAVHSLAIFAGLSDTAHRVTIKQITGTATYCALVTSTMLALTGAAPAIGLPDAAHANSTQFDLTGTFYTLNASPVNTHMRLAPSWNTVSNGGVNQYQANWTDSVMQFHMNTTNGTTWKIQPFYADSSSSRHFQVLIDGVEQGLLASPAANNNSWTYALFATGVGDGAAHDVQIVLTDAPTSVFTVWYGFMLIGATQDQSISYAQLDIWSTFGDSITAATTTGQNDSTIGYMFRLGQNKLKTIANRGIGGSTVISSGQSRTTDITSISPQVKKCFVLYGTNDIAGVSTPSATFGTAFVSMLNSLLAGTTATQFYVMGIIPKSGTTSATITNWNGSGNGIQGSIAAVIAATPAYASRLTYLDTSLWNLSGVVYGTDFATNYIADGIHPNLAGYTLFLLNLGLAVGGLFTREYLSSFAELTGGIFG